jgi:diacylglycerol kinase family enzyme
MTRARRIDVKLKKPLTYELDGGARGEVKRIRVEVAPAAVKVCVPSQRVG